VVRAALETWANFGSRPFRILMRLMKPNGEKETVDFPGERFLDVG
jgi:hypothetical protein